MTIWRIKFKPYLDCETYVVEVQAPDAKSAEACAQLPECDVLSVTPC